MYNIKAKTFVPSSDINDKIKTLNFLKYNKLDDIYKKYLESIKI
jgi:hypothetical protein